MCEDGLTDKDYFMKCYNEGVELTAYICKMYGLDPLGTTTYNGVKVPIILCHQDSYQLGLGSNHGDIYNWFNKHGKTMDDVRNDVAKLLKEAETPVVAVNYQVEVTAGDGLNCRTSPMTGTIIKTYTKGTILTITKEQGCWGYDGTGWVCLEYTKKYVTPTPTPPKEEPPVEDAKLKEFTELWHKMTAAWYDNDSADWSAKARQWAIDTGLMNGIGKLADGTQNYAWEALPTREQLVTILYRFAELIGKV